MNRFDLYELCVQSPAMQARFLRALTRGLQTAPADDPRHDLVLAEDFAGSASIARAWAALGPGHRAIIIDRDAEPLEHARARACEHLGTAFDQLEFRCRDVLHAAPHNGPEADVLAAFNFAVCELHERADLLLYLRHARRRLRPGGIAAFDLYLGASAFIPGEAEQVIPGPDGPVRYTWEQRAADPLTGRVLNAIHFDLPNGRRLRDVFVYDWRLWSVPELRDAMAEAGFTSTEVHAGYGDAIDEAGDPHPRPIVDPDELDPDNAVVYVVGRIDPSDGA